MPLELESMPLPSGYFWRSLPADDRYRAVLCHGTPPNVNDVVAYVNTRAEALSAIDDHRALLAAEAEHAAALAEQTPTPNYRAARLESEYDRIAMLPADEVSRPVAAEAVTNG